MSIILARIGIIIVIICGYLLAKNVDRISGNTITMYGGGIVVGIILFIIGLSSVSKEDYKDMSNKFTEYYSQF